MKLSTFFATELTYGGYGYIGEQYRRLLPAFGFEMLPPDQFGWDALLAFTPPRANLVGPHRRPDLILHTMFEATPMPATWVEICNQVGLIWTPSHWCAELFRQCGVTTPIMVAGYGYDPRWLMPVDRRGRQTPLTVIVWGDILTSRKWLLASVRAFLCADLPHARLELKIHDPLVTTPLIIRGDDGEPDPRITVLQRPMSRQALCAWLQHGDVLLDLTGGEGFGLRPLEAMATGMPVICMRETGMRMYMQPGAVLEVPALGMRPVPTLTLLHKQVISVYEPDVEAAANHLRWVAAHRDAAAELGMYGYETVRAYTWERAVEEAVPQLLHFSLG